MLNAAAAAKEAMTKAAMTNAAAMKAIATAKAATAGAKAKPKMTHQKKALNFVFSEIIGKLARFCDWEKRGVIKTF